MDIVKIIKNNTYNPYGILRKCDLLKDVIKKTSFLNELYDNIPYSQRYWHIRNDEYKIIKCKCGKPIKWDNKHKYYKTCGDIKCKRKSLESNINCGREDIVQIIKSHSTSGALTKLFNQKEEIINLTSFLNKYYKQIKWGQRFWHIRNNEYKVKTCKNKKCNKIARYTKYGYISCSKKCEEKLRRETYKKNNSGKNFSIKLRERLHDKLHDKYKKLLGKEYKILNLYDLKFKHTVCGTIFHVNKQTIFGRNRRNHKICTKCNPIEKFWSNNEKELLNYISSSYNKKIVTNSKSIIKPYELDIYLPDLNLAIEFNGLYWHSELYKNKDYHKEKSILCSNKGIQLIHVWEDDWLYKQEIVKSIISGYLNKHSKIYARKCIIKEIEAKDCKEFINDCHIQSFVPATIYYGLFFENELVQIMSFKRIKDNDWEISRLCSKLNISIIGGASRLFKHFIKDYKILNIISYSNNDYFSGKIYEKLGMNFIKETEPNYFYIDRENTIRLSRQKFQKHKLVKQGYDENKSESQIMLERGYLKIYNSGNKKFLKW